MSAEIDKKRANIAKFGRPNITIFDVPVELIRLLDDNADKGLDIILEWLDSKYHQVHENGRYEAAKLVDSYWRDYLYPKLKADGVAGLEEWEKYWLDCANKIKEGSK